MWIAKPTQGTIQVHGLDHHLAAKKIRALIGLVPQELATDAFEKVIDTVSFSRGLFGFPKDTKFIEKILSDLSLLDKNNMIRTLSGGMKRRVMIAKALSHEPKILFLDEPSAGVDVQLRESMWELVKDLRKNGVTIILTTHYIEEAERIADRIAVINKGQIIIVNEKEKLMKELGIKTLTLDLVQELKEIPAQLLPYKLEVKGLKLIYSYHTSNDNNLVSKLIHDLNQLNIPFKDIHTEQSSLEDIFVQLVK